MSSNFNNAKIINVYYNKGDRKPYDVNGKPIAYIGEEFVGSNEGSELRFFFGQDLDSATPMIITKRPDGETHLDLCEKVGTGANSYYKVVLNNWYAEVKGKLTLIFKVYNGEVELNEGNTEIVSASGQVIVSDIFNLEVGYAPLATSAVPPYDPDPEESWYFALSQKLDKADSITVAGALPTLTGDVYDDRYFYIENEGVGRLYYINGSSAIEVVFQVGTLRLTPTGNGDITDDTGKLSWNQPNGTAQLGLYNDVNIGIGEDVVYYGKASATITKGQVIQFGGYQGDHILMKPAVPSEINANPKLILGIAKQAITSGDFGYVAHFGKIEGYDSGAFAVGSLLWFNSGSGSNGLLTATQPTAPNAKILMAALIKAETSGAANNGVLQVRIDIEPKLEELQNVLITSATNGNVLSYDGTKWVNSTRLTTAETDISNIEDGTTIVGKALGDQNGNTINTTYLTIASGSSTYVPLSSKGVANGVAPLGSDNKIPSIHLPGGVDDIKEFANLGAFPAVGEASIIYVALDTNIIYRWSGSAYVEISSSLALGTTSSTAFPGDRGLATETKTDNIVSGTQTLTNTRITNSATNVNPLIINTISGTTANLQEWQLNGTGNARISSGGTLSTRTRIENWSDGNNAKFEVLTTGPVISRNIADANPSLIVNQANASSTGDILRLQSAGANVLEITRTGGLNQNGTRLFSQPVEVTNTFFGSSSGGTATTGTLNTGFGVSALTALTSGSSNTAVGRNALTSLTTGGNNVSVGVNSLNIINTGSSNVGVGFLSGTSLTGSASNNTFIGRDAGNNASQLATATNSTGIGNQAYTDKSNQMVFGNASVSEFVFNRNTGATALLPIVSASSSSAHTIERTTGITNTSNSSSLLITRTTTGDMVDGFGSRLSFVIKDDANNNNLIASIGGVRSGADNSGRMAFTLLNAGTENERMTILPDGKVGIGTASPATTLSVVLEANTDELQIRRNSGTTNDYATLGFRIATTDSGANLAEVRAVRTNRAVSTDTDLVFTTQSNSSLGERLRIRDDGLVGINETSPSAQLQVKSGATNRVPLVIDTLSGHTAFLQDWKLNGTTRTIIQSNGRISTFEGISNLTSSVNAYVNVSATGTIISRDVADSNPALITNIANASSTANVQVWQKATNALLAVSNDGSLINPTAANSKLSLTSTGALIERNINDANVALKINQQQGTGKIASFQFGGVEKSYIDKDGNFSGASVVPTYTYLGGRAGSAGDGNITVTDITTFDEIVAQLIYDNDANELFATRVQAPVSTHFQPGGSGDLVGVAVMTFSKGGTTLATATVGKGVNNTTLVVDFGGTVTDAYLQVYGINY
jgi:hypothetical protein